jgi:hypothetical protein
MVEKRQDNGFDGCSWGGECISSAHSFLLGQARRQLTCIIAHCVPLHRAVLRGWPESLPKLSSVRSSAVYRSCCVVEQIGLLYLAMHWLLRAGERCCVFQDRHQPIGRRRGALFAPEFLYNALSA